MRIVNKTAPRDFAVEQKFEAGVVLLGQEVKAVKLGHADLTGSYVKVIGLEAYLVNARIFPYAFARTEGYQETRTRKLLLHKKQLLELKNKLAEGKHTLVGLALYATKSGLIKVEIGLAKGKKQADKRLDLKKRTLEREAEIELKNYS
ncbi:MAG: SsrA-binding protein SmpB [Candidatus Levyibacteriota bacterium]